MPKPQPNTNPKPFLWFAIVPALIVLGAGLWWLTRSPVELSEDHYAITLALYRVCNQQNMAGLEPIEALLATPDSPLDETSDSLVVIESIILDARQQRWERATENCRKLLDDQVDR